MPCNREQIVALLRSAMCHKKARALSISSRTVYTFISVRTAKTWLYSACAFCFTAAGTANPSSRQSISCAHAGHST